MRYLIIILLITISCSTENHPATIPLKNDTVPGVVTLMNKGGETLTRRCKAVYANGHITGIICPNCHWIIDLNNWYEFIPESKLY